MLGRLNHVAIAVPDLEAAARTYASVLGAKVSGPQTEAAHGVRVVFVDLPNTKRSMRSLGKFCKHPLALLRHFKPARFKDVAFQKMPRELEAVENVCG